MIGRAYALMHTRFVSLCFWEIKGLCLNFDPVNGFRVASVRHFAGRQCLLSV